jgi:hypothetical protein
MDGTAVWKVGGMNVNSTSTDNDLIALAAYQGNNHTANALPLLTENGQNSPPKHHSSDNSQLSGPGQLFSELASLSTSNPAAFQKLTRRIAQELQNAAANPSGTAEQNGLLNQLAASFQTASASGQFSDLFGQTESSFATAAASGETYGFANSQPAASAFQAAAKVFSDALSLIK